MENRHIVIQANELYHHGILGQKWGIRRFQTYDGAYTAAGKERYGVQGRAEFKRKAKESDDRTQAMNDDMKAVNGGMMAVRFAKDRHANCAFCTTAYELRRRGYDVKAKESSAGVLIDLDPSYAFKDAKVERFESAPNGYTKAKWAEIEKKIVEEQGEGARGNLFGTYKNSFAGHSVAYEIQNGKMVVLDCQVAERFDNSHDFAKDFNSLNAIRTDNLEIDEKYIGDYVGNRSDVKTRVDKGKMISKTLLLGGLGGIIASNVMAFSSSNFGDAKVVVAAMLASAASVKVASLIDKSRRKREAAESDAMVSKTLDKLNIDVEEASKRLNKIYNPEKPEPKPKPTPTPTPAPTTKPAIVARVRSMYDSGRYTREQLAKKLGISVSLVEEYLA